MGSRTKRATVVAQLASQMGLSLGYFDNMTNREFTMLRNGTHIGNRSYGETLNETAQRESKREINKPLPRNTFGETSDENDEKDRYDNRTGFRKPAIYTRETMVVNPELLQLTHEIRYHADHSTTNNRVPLNTKKPAKRVDNTTNQKIA